MPRGRVMALDTVASTFGCRCRFRDAGYRVLLAKVASD